MRHVDLPAVLPGLRFIHLTRRDRLQQAVSSWRAVTTGKWHYTSGDRLTGGPRYDFDAIKRHYERILVEDALWNAYFVRHTIHPLRVEYETYVRSRRTILEEVAAYLNAEPARTSIVDDLRVMRDSWTDGIVGRFWEELNHLEDTEPPAAYKRAYRRLVAVARPQRNTVAERV
jgi:LPS sulfotransferase NodH